MPQKLLWMSREQCSRQFILKIVMNETSLRAFQTFQSFTLFMSLSYVSHCSHSSLLMHCFVQFFLTYHIALIQEYWCTTCLVFSYVSYCSDSNILMHCFAFKPYTFSWDAFHSNHHLTFLLTLLRTDFAKGCGSSSSTSWLIYWLAAAYKVFW
jgi:hypothetical protein